MKKFLVLLIVVSVIAVNKGNAQQNKIDIGMEGGVNVALLYGNDYTTSYDIPTIAYAGGAFFQYNFPKRFSIRTNLWYEKKGTERRGNELDANNNTVPFSSHNNMNYLTIPLLLRYNLEFKTFGKPVTCFFNAGPYFGMLMSQVTVTDGLYPSNVSRIDDFKKNDFGVAAGLGFVYPLKDKFGISFEVRNNLGLPNISNIPVYNDGTIKTNCTNFLLGFAFKIGTKESGDASK